MLRVKQFSNSDLKCTTSDTSARWGTRAERFSGCYERTLNRKPIPACKGCHKQIHRGEYDGIRLHDLAYDFVACPRWPGTGEPDAMKVCVVVRSVESLLQTGGVQRKTSGSPDLPEGESWRGKQHVREAGDIGRRL